VPDFSYSIHSTKQLFYLSGWAQDELAVRNAHRRAAVERRAVRGSPPHVVQAVTLDGRDNARSSHDAQVDIVRWIFSARVRRGLLD